MAAEKRTRDDCLLLLRQKQEQLQSQGLTRYPQRSDFDDNDVMFIKSYFGPWPRALEAAGIKEPRGDDRKQKNREKRARAKRRLREAKKAEQAAIRKADSGTQSMEQDTEISTGMKTE